MTNPIPFKAEVSGGLEEAPSGAIPISLYGDVGGGSGGNGVPGGPVETDESGLIASGEVYLAPLGRDASWKLMYSPEEGLHTLVGLEVEGQMIWTVLPQGVQEGGYLDGSTGIPRVTDSSTVITANYGLDNVLDLYGSVANSTITLGREQVAASTKDMSSGSRKHASMSLFRGSHNVTAGVEGQDQVKMASQSDGIFSVSSGEHESSNTADRVNVLRLSLGRVEGDLELRAGHYKDLLVGEPEPQGPYLAAVDDGIITLAALRKYVEDTIGYGGPGQVLATNSTGDGYEWVDGGAND